MSPCHLADKQCVPCSQETPPLSGTELARLHKRLDKDWQLVNGHHLEKRYRFDDFLTALDFVNRVGEIAEEQGHHPDIELRWGEVVLTIWTHKIDGLSENDFILADRADRALKTPQ